MENDFSTATNHVQRIVVFGESNATKIEKTWLPLAFSATPNCGNLHEGKLMSFVITQESVQNKMKLNDEWDQFIKNIDRLRIENADSDLSENLLDLLVAGEDHRFWSHFGVDPVGLVRAIWKTAFCNKREGGSTIAMQLVRTVTGHYEISTQRKLKEIYLATKITFALERKEILKLYLKVAYFGWNMHGVEQACKRLDLDITSLTNYEAAAIVARLKYPEPRFGSSNSVMAVHHRANHIINKLNQLNSKGKYGTV